MPPLTKLHVKNKTMFPYFPHTEEDVRQMLDKVGVKSLDELYSDVPQEFVYRKEYDLPDAKSEIEVRRYFEGLAAMNSPLTCFAGAGAYDHYAPAVIPYITSRAEFLTAYTPYQAEISQGTLRYIFEYQSMICELTGMDCSNASMYDGATAAAEACFMAVASTKKCNKVLVSETLQPQVLAVVKTYADYHGLEIEMLAGADGQTLYGSLLAKLAEGGVAGVLVPTVNRYGIIEDLTGFADAAHAVKALFMTYSDPSSLAVLRSPAEWGADVACGDCQTLGIPMCYGGPYVGYLACRKDYVRKLPGRIVGATVDAEGKRCFVLTLQAREQHIRREKATSNICSNQSLMALYVTVYLSLMGKSGLKQVNEQSYGGAHYLHEQLLGTGLFTAPYDKPFLKEFVLATSLDVKALHKYLADKGMFAALPVGDGLVNFCVTEKRTKEEIDELVSLIKNLF